MSISCAAASTGYGLSANKLYIDAALNSTSASYVYCLNVCLRFSNISIPSFSFSSTGRQSRRWFVHHPFHARCGELIHSLDGSSAALTSVSCSALQTYWNKTAGFYNVGGVAGTFALSVLVLRSLDLLFF